MTAIDLNMSPKVDANADSLSAPKRCDRMKNRNGPNNMVLDENIGLAPIGQQQAEDVHGEFCVKTQMALLTARVVGTEKRTSGADERISGLEKQAQQLMNSLDEMVGRYSIKDQTSCEPSCGKALDRIDTIVQRLQSLETSIPIIIIDTITDYLNEKFVIETNTIAMTSADVKQSLPAEQKEGTFHLSQDVKHSPPAEQKEGTFNPSPDVKQSLPAEQKEGPFNPESDQNLVADYLFDSRLDMRYMIYDFNYSFICMLTNFINFALL